MYLKVLLGQHVHYIFITKSIKLSYKNIVHMLV
jgi:hypothetical protein